MRRLALWLAYYLLVTPYGMVRRLVADPLTRRWDPDAGSYFVPTEPPGARAQGGTR